MNLHEQPILSVCQHYGMTFRRDQRGELYAFCPFHEDKQRPNFTINMEKNCWYCFACKKGGGVIDLIRLKEGKSRNQVLGVGRPHYQTEQITCTYDYRDEKGELRYQVCRLEPKDFRQRRPGAAKGVWIWNMDGVTPIPYKLDEIIKRPKAVVWITEGERDVLTLNSIAQLATTNSGGANKWTDAHSKWLTGREVVLCGDNDEPGRRHMDNVFNSVHAYAKCVTRVELPVKFKDVTELKESFNTPGDFAAALGVRMGQPVPGLFYATPEGWSEAEISTFQKILPDVEPILPVTPKGRRCVCDALWTAVRSFHGTTHSYEKTVTQEIHERGADII